MYDLIIVGGGPAGLTAALFALRANKKVLVLEAKYYGGQILNANKIENYPSIELISGYDFATNLYNQVIKMGCEFKIETVTRIEKDLSVITNKDRYESKAVIIATGATHKKLNIENENKFIGKGVSYCSSCDGNFYKDKTVAVIGGGDTALEDALLLSGIAKKVYLIHHNDNIKGEEADLNNLRSKNNVEFLFNTNVTKLNGNDKLENIEINENNNIRNIDVDGIFIAIGQEPKNEIFANIVDLDERGYIISKDGVHTNIDGIYIAGDNRQKELRQLTTAVADGSIAATLAIKERMSKNG